MTTAELLAGGLSHHQIGSRRLAGLLHPLHRGVYAVGHPNIRWEGRLLAAAKACGPEAVVSHRSAGALWGFLDREQGGYPDVTVLGSGGNRHPEIRVHRTSALPLRDRSRLERVPLTSPARTLLDLGAQLDRPALRAAIRRAQGLKRVNLRQLHEVLERRRPCKGSRRLADAIATGSAPTRSVLEDVVLDLVLGAGFTHPDVNRPLVVGGRRVIPDFRWPDRRLVIEADGAAWHEGGLARDADAERQALLEEAGERVLRVTWLQAVAQPSATLRRIANAGAPRRSERGVPRRAAQ